MNEPSAKDVLDFLSPLPRLYTDGGTMIDEMAMDVILRALRLLAIAEHDDFISIHDDTDWGHAVYLYTPTAKRWIGTPDEAFAALYPTSAASEIERLRSLVENEVLIRRQAQVESCRANIENEELRAEIERLTDESCADQLKIAELANKYADAKAEIERLTDRGRS